MELFRLMEVLLLLLAVQFLVVLLVAVQAVHLCHQQVQNPEKMAVQVAAVVVLQEFNLVVQAIRQALHHHKEVMVVRVIQTTLLMA
jgi:hypothetical protein